MPHHLANHQRITGMQLKEMLMAGAHYLEKYKQTINDLNVFPVPDGDTGTNMVLTVSGAVDDLRGLPADVSLGIVADTASDAALLSARGNSGVILSQFIRGLARSLLDKKWATTTEVAKAFQYGLVYAYQAVTTPVEGTILTVAREIARGSRRNVRESNSLAEILTHALTVGYNALANTPNQLPILKEAGVVDAGGKGLLVFLTGCLAGLKGDIPEELAEREINRTHPSAVFQTEAEEDLEYNYCTETIVKYSAKPDLAKLKLALKSLGDCLLLVEGKGVLKFHLHTNHPGKALEILLNHGTLHDIKIDNMSEQHRRTIAATVPLAAVCVSPGAGLDEAFKSLGASAIITGGDTMNPSVKEILQAITETSAENILVLPNNANIRLAAEQAAAALENKVKIVPTESVMQGLAAMLQFDVNKSIEDNFHNMLAGSQMVQYGRITFAARESDWQNRHLKKGAVLGFSRKELLVVSDDVAEATVLLVKQMVNEDSELLTLFYGREITQKTSEEIVQLLQENFPALEIELKKGGQPHDYFLMMLE